MNRIDIMRTTRFIFENWFDTCQICVTFEAQTANIYLLKSDFRILRRAIIGLGKILILVCITFSLHCDDYTMKQRSNTLSVLWGWLIEQDFCISTLRDKGLMDGGGKWDERKQTFSRERLIWKTQVNDVFLNCRQTYPVCCNKGYP